MEQTIDLNMSISFDAANLDARTLQNLIHMIYSRGQLLKSATGGLFDASRTLLHLLAHSARCETVRDVVSVIAAHDAVYGPGLTGVTIPPESITFTGFPEAPDVLTLRAYGQLAYLMLNFSSEAKRVPARRSEIFNVKYAFRAWLVALGMNGPDFSESQAALLRDLPGCCNYRTEETRERAMERAREKRGAKKRGKIEFVYTE